ncbi:SMI1/KNR4 family protein [Acaryochloris marina]|uniref:SMI1/KNR4 family protein n=1 Tax=Acaryochloris marina TaxID=155978 RepID=UPI001BAF3D75|nr:SMI1/KNR4 family protein [Acaryochloris marina]QUY41458.1 SMI1/KNR4 family protein [Acaryochloris marina S15]
MELLISSLEKILDVWKQDRADFIELLQPGLNIQDIQQYVSNLPFQLPQEVYQLYHWRNGVQILEFHDISLDFIPGFWFLPLAETLKTYKHLKEFKKNCTFLKDKAYHRPWFPILSSDLGYFLVLGDRNTFISSPVFFLSWNSGDLTFETRYPSLTSMMTVIAECYESGAYYFETKVMDQFGTIVEFLEEDPQEASRIRLKYL